MERAQRRGKEFGELWEKLDNLKRLESEVAPTRTCAEIKAEITDRLGYFPPFFIPALSSPAVLDSLWRQQLSAYHENPLPKLLKEKLALRLSRYCASPYFLIVHACILHRLGVAAGEVMRLANLSALNEAGVEYLSEILARVPHPLQAWPLDDPAIDESLATCCMAVFLGTAGADVCADELRNILGTETYDRLTILMANIKASHLWVEAHPEISAEEVFNGEILALVRSEPRMEQILQNHRDDRGRHLLRRASGDRALQSDERYRELFENASDIIYTHDFQGRLTSINRAVERIAGYTRSEALQLNITELITPEYAPLGRKMIDPQIGGEIPLNCELEIVAKEGARVAVEISTRPVFHAGRAVGVQGIARDVTKRKKTEVELHHANQKLEAWVTELEQRTREMTLLNDMGDILRACLTTEEAYKVIVRVAQQIFPAQVGALYVIAPSRNLVEAAALWGDSGLVERAFSPEECWALRRGRTHWVENSHAGMICRHIHHAPSDGYMCIPMMAQSEALGVLHLMQPDNVKMTDTKQRMAITMSEHIAMALSNLRLHETLRSQSIRDPLTGLFNRRFMEESLELEIRRATRNQRPLGMIMIDLDHFKYFNDNFGHQAGDLLLKELGTLLKNNIRGEDIACRYGGEEFTLILPEGTGAVTRQRAEFFKEAIQRLDVNFRGHPLGKITASMGVAVFPDHGRTAKALVEAADKALYRSKAAGRDRVTLAG
jgi:diguanylate cyclase (GGDEF)-like protein/PAS domain S-box-containing protein